MTEQRVTVRSAWLTVRTPAQKWMLLRRSFDAGARVA
jgi:hypothetical protein